MEGCLAEGRAAVSDVGVVGWMGHAAPTPQGNSCRQAEVEAVAMRVSMLWKGTSSVQMAC